MTAMTVPPLAATPRPQPVPQPVPGPLGRLGMGGAQIGSIGNKTPIAETRRTLAAAFERGVRVFDTADIYGQGDSEREIGRVIAGRRDQAVLVTKAGRLFSAKARLMRPLKPVLVPLIRSVPSLKARVVGARDGTMATDFSGPHLVAALEASLRRLGTDHVDALLLHSPPASVARDPATAAALQALLDGGKAARVGLACDDYATLEAAVALPQVSVVEVPLSLLDEAATSGLAAVMQARGIWTIAREVIRLSPGVPPPEAVARAIAREDVGTAVVGMSSRRHLEQILERLGATPQ